MPDWAVAALAAPFLAAAAVVEVASSFIALVGFLPTFIANLFAAFAAAFLKTLKDFRDASASIIISETNYC